MGRSWGILIPLHAIDGGLAGLEAWWNWARDLGAGFVATLPILEPVPGERSPYSPSTRLRWNPEYGDVSAVAERVPLYLDFPIGVHPEGDDVKRYPHLFAKGFAVGAPPDAFFTKGQNWGFPPLDPEAMRADRFQYFRAAIAHHARHATILRIDHVMGLYRLYWIPDDAEATEGRYVRYPEEELFSIVAEEAARHGCTIVGEDLGTVPKEVPELMNRYGFRRMFVAQYEFKDDDRVLRTPPAMSVASVNTHDMPPFAAFWTGKDIGDRLARGLLDEAGARKTHEARANLRRRIQKQFGVKEREEAFEAILTYLAKSPAELVLVNLEDLWGETEPQNVPGVPEESWKQRFRLTLDEARKDPTVRRILAQLH